MQEENLNKRKGEIMNKKLYLESINMIIDRVVTFVTISLSQNPTQLT